MVRPKPHTAQRRPRRLGRRLIAFVVVLFIAYLGWSLVAEPRALYNGQVAAVAAPNTSTLAAIAWPAYGQAAIGTTAGGLLASNGTETAVPIASVAKIMLALSVMREKPFADGEQGDTLTLSQSDVDIYNHYVSVDGSVALVAAGEQITEYQALQALLLPSANNMAESLAIWAFGSVDGYTAYANDYASQLGLKDTHFNDASGFDPGTVSSAVNLVKLGQLALKNAVIADIVDQPSATIPVAGKIRNVNSLLMSGNGFIGIKTGNTDQAGGCMLFAANHTVGDEKVSIIGAIVGAPNLQTALRDSGVLMASAKQNFVDSTIVRQRQVVGSYQTAWGSHVNAVAVDSLDTPTWKGTNIKPEVVITPLRLPASAGQNVGKVVADSPTAGSGTSVKVVLAGDISNPSWFWRITHPGATLPF